jgi:plasmid maintenance system antidote protein VapI
LTATAPTLTSTCDPAAAGFSYYFGMSAKFWLGLQDDYDLEEEAKAKKSELESIKKYENDAA